MIDQGWRECSQWDRIELKKSGKAAIIRNYTDVVLASIIYILFAIGYGSSTLNVTTGAGNDLTGQIFLDLQSLKEVQQNIFSGEGSILLNAWNEFLHYSSPITDGLHHLDRIVNAKDASTLLIALLALMLVGGFTLFIKNILIVGDRRFFLENRIYCNTQLSSVLFVYKRRVLGKVAWVMFVKSALQILWSLTIVGGFIKYYSYRLVPFILAENPSIDARSAITLSRGMMNGNKLRWFRMDITFLPWRLLSGFTFQLAGFLFVYGYIRSTEAFLFAQLRKRALSYRLAGSSQLNDTMLYQPTATSQEYYPAYAPNMERSHLKAYFGRHYPLFHLIILFFVFSLFGWMWEVSLHLIRDGVFINRGYLHGPWLPIYGVGGVLILLLLKRFRRSVFLTFVTTILLCGTLEYATSWFLEVTQGKRWWDYSDYLFNINGRVCLEVLLIFAVGGCAIVYLIAPNVDDYLQKIPAKGKIPLAVILVMLFSFDFYYTHSHPTEGQGITTGNVVLSETGLAAVSTTGNQNVIDEPGRPQECCDSD